MSQPETIPVKPEIAANALVDRAKYDDMARRAAENPEAFWAE